MNNSKKLKRILVFIVLMVLVGFINSNAQVNPIGTKLDEAQLALYPGTSVVSDATADGGSAIFRPASAVSTYMWYGPYMHLQGGNYLVQIRLKVASNTSGSTLLNFDVVSNVGAVSYTGLAISPNMFRNSNEWQLFTLPVRLPDNVADYEIRGSYFTAGITDVYLDYITILPGDVRGFYSNEFTVTGTGGVGIGTQNLNGYKLAVKGNIHAQQVNVDLTNWPDYVFKPTYQLPSLTDVKTYIDQNHHLPDMPSEQEVAKDGINLGEMNKLLTKKIEELTLYLIEKDREIKAQQEDNQSLHAEMNELKKQISLTKNH